MLGEALSRKCKAGVSKIWKHLPSSIVCCHLILTGDVLCSSWAGQLLSATSILLAY